MKISENYEVDVECLDDDTEHEYTDEEEEYDRMDAESIVEVNGIEALKCAAHSLALGVDDTVTKLKSKKRFKKFKALAKFLRTST